MKRVWAPWRNPYIKSNMDLEECFFCSMIKQNKDKENLILFRSHKVFVVLNKYPYTNGHLMVVPYEHISSLSKLDQSTRNDLIEVTSTAIEWIKLALKSEGINAGMNLGKVAGAGLEGHLHMHIVPRWTGDSNFMTSIAETRVISVSLEETYRILEDTINRKGVNL